MIRSVMMRHLEEQASPQYKLKDRDFETIKYIYQNKLLKKQGNDIYVLVDDMIKEIERLRAICKLVVIHENDRIARRWNQPARR